MAGHVESVHLLLYSRVKEPSEAVALTWPLILAIVDFLRGEKLRRSDCGCFFEVAGRFLFIGDPTKRYPSDSLLSYTDTRLIAREISRLLKGVGIALTTCSQHIELQGYQDKLCNLRKCS